MKLLFTKEEILSMPQEVKYERAYPGTPFTLKGLACQEDKPGHWSTSIVAIYRDGALLGGYRRTYSSLGAETFYPVQWKGQWYGLYSANYTCTRALLLNADSIEDWCGEDPGSWGFCPAEYYLPQVAISKYEDHDIRVFENEYETYAEFIEEAKTDDAEITYPGFGFLCGCIWGDDSDMKLRYIDYSRIDERVLKIDERFGYHPLPNQALAKCVDLSGWEPEHPLIYASKRVYFIAKDPQPEAVTEA